MMESTRTAARSARRLARGLATASPCTVQIPRPHLAVTALLVPPGNPWVTAAEARVCHPAPGARQLKRHASLSSLSDIWPSHQRRLSVASISASQSGPPVKPYKAPAAGFKVFRITGDGSCMFRAIVQGVEVHTKGRPMAQSSETTAALNLRAAVVQELRNRRAEMEPFIAGITDDWEDYLARMAHPAAWGGEPEMVMAVNVIRRPITVYHATAQGIEPIVTYGEELSKGGTQPVHLLWSGMHYDLLIPAQEPPSTEAASAA